MLPIYIFIAFILILALIGLITCFVRWLWLTVGGLVFLGAFVAYAIPSMRSDIPYWIGAGVVIAVSLVIAQGYRQPRAPMSPKDRPGIVVDGTNVIYWDNQTPQLDTLRDVVTELKRRNLVPTVFLDASSRHHLKDKSLTEKGFARALGLPLKNVTVCPAGTEADVFILKYARAEKLPVLSNDRFGDRSDLAKGLKIVKGVIAKGRPILDGL